MVNNTAEWVVERPNDSVNGQETLENLANYGNVQMINCYTETTTGVWFAFANIYPHWNLYQDEMTNSSNQTLSYANGSNSLNINWQWRQSF